jgi:hypothetical protein
MNSINMAITIDASCSHHPLLPVSVRSNLPKYDYIKISPLKLYGYASMHVQDPSRAGVSNYAEVRTKANSILDLYGHGLSFGNNSISVTCDPEIKTKLSEMVGVGAGLAASCKIFGINPNRISRFIQSGKGKRMDFIATKSGASFLIETRGTTSSKKHSSMIKEVGPKKTSPLSSGYTAYSGAITLFGISNSTTIDRITVVDPIGDGAPKSELDEISSMVKHYASILKLTHFRSQFISELETWYNNYNLGDITLHPPAIQRGVTLRARYTDDIDGIGKVCGTIFDHRTLKSTVNAVDSFRMATELYKKPTILMGLHREVVDLIKRGAWKDLLSYELKSHNQDVECLESGLILSTFQLSSEEEREVESDFNRQKSRFKLGGGL